jgi:ubiquitin-activating enzyme E1
MKLVGFFGLLYHVYVLLNVVSSTTSPNSASAVASQSALRPSSRSRSFRRGVSVKSTSAIDHKSPLSQSSCHDHNQAGAEEAGTEAEIAVDEQLYSRQLFVYGRSAQKRLSGSHILLYGGADDVKLLAEVAKNLALAGVGKLSIRMPPTRKTKQHSGSPQNHKHSSLLGDSKDLISYCSELNPLVQVREVFDGSQGTTDLSQYTVIVACGTDVDGAVKLNAKSRASKVPLVFVRGRGLSGVIFDDFGDGFHVEDATGEAAKEVPLQSAVLLEDKNDDGGRLLSLKCIEEESFGLGIGDHCDLEVATAAAGGGGGTSLLSSNSPSEEGEAGHAHEPQSQAIKRVEVVSVASPTSITVKVSDHVQARKLVAFLGQGRSVVAKRALESMTVRHMPLESALLNPTFTQCNGCLSTKQDRAWSLCLLSAFLAIEGPPIDTKVGHTARSLRTGILAVLIGMGIEQPLAPLRKGGVGVVGVDCVERLVQSSFLHMKDVSCAATVSVLGPLAAQEVIKAVTHIHAPVSQFLVFESFDSLLPQDCDLSCAGEGKTASSSSSSSYGDLMCNELKGLKIFVVGSGAIGCEVLKTLALMGVSEGGGDDSASHPRTSSTTTPATSAGCGTSSLWSGLEGGGVVLTDMDSIERSNLNRQLLFRQRHVGQPKAIVAAEMAQRLNPRFKVRALTSKVAAETEALFDDAFWKEVDVVVTALDNVDARRYVDEKCVQHQKVLLDSGTLGTKGNTQVVLPFLSESYGSSADPPEEAVPLCTLKSFPYLSDHCVSWGRALFMQCFNDDIDALQSCMAAADKPGRALENFLGDLGADDQRRLLLLLELVCKSTEGQDGQGILVEWAVSLFDRVFHTDMLELLGDNPPDKVDEDGTPFWGGARRAPVPQRFDPTQQEHAVFVTQSIRLMCRVCDLAALQSIPDPSKPEMDPLIQHLMPYFTSAAVSASSSQQQSRQPAEAEQQQKAVVTRLAACVRNLQRSQSGQQQQGLARRLRGEEFEKDDLSLGHVAFVAAASNIRCQLYSLPPVDSLTVQRIAGKIVPAVATTTSLVAGLVSLELLKIASERIRYRAAFLLTVGKHGVSAHQHQSEFTRLDALGLTGNGLEQEKDRLLARFRNTFANLARPLLAFAQPVCADEYPSPLAHESFTMWSVLEPPSALCEGRPTIASLELWLRDRLGQPGLELQSVSCGESLVYASFLHARECATDQACQTVLLRARASHGATDEGEEGEGEGERDDHSCCAEDTSALAVEQRLARLAQAELALAQSSTVDLEIGCVSAEREDLQLPRLRLKLDFEVLARDVAELKGSIVSSHEAAVAAAKQKQKQKEEEEQQHQQKLEVERAQRDKEQHGQREQERAQEHVSAIEGEGEEGGGAAGIRIVVSKGLRSLTAWAKETITKGDE